MRGPRAERGGRVEQVQLIGRGPALGHERGKHLPEPSMSARVASEAGRSGAVECRRNLAGNSSATWSCSAPRARLLWEHVALNLESEDERI
jgi:hypothetical protein